MRFEWDEDKNAINKEKHKISFETAVYVFDDPHYIEMFDFEHSVSEDRYIANCQTDFSQTGNKGRKGTLL